MRYRDQQPPEGINVTQRHPLRELALLLGGALLLVVIAVALLSFFGGRLARLIPPATEAALVSNYELPVRKAGELEHYLRGLGERIAAEMSLPEGLEVRIHVLDTEELNAFATLGGNLVLFRGLLERLPHENALAFLLAHEIAHLKHRDPIAVLGQGALVGIGLALLVDSSGLPLLESAGLLTRLKFSREMEERADATALRAVVAVYGHARGAADLMRILTQTPGSDHRPPAIFSTHPDPEDRITVLADAQPSAGDLTPLAAEFRAWLQ